MSTFSIVLLVILAVLIIVIAVLYFLGKKAQKKQAAQQEQMEAAKQTVSMLIIDKKRMKIKDSGLPQMVIDQTPKLMRGSKLPIVKAKIGPQIMSLVCDEKIFDSIPVKKEVKAVVSGIYITEVKGLHGKTGVATTGKKKGKFKQMVEKLQEKAGRGLFVALLLFVGIPLPGTGAWTGTLAASLLDMGFKKSVIAVLLGVLLAGVIMGIASAGVFTAIFSFT